MNDLQKFINGQTARNKWAKDINLENPINVNEFNDLINEFKFIECAKIVLDNGRSNNTIKVVPNDKKLWNKQTEMIYIIARNNIILKIGGTRTGMKGRWSSYLCGHCVPERKNKKGNPYPGKMSVTNAYLYHTIENDLLETNSDWAFYITELPIIEVDAEILGKTIKIVVQTYHAYESQIIKKFKELSGNFPILCNNCDPKYLN